ncbi:MAG: glutamate-5-semialdehyde dehydrogenase [Armatimonadota bacterium]|nr:glutamate-5-semialdehyde dehydrogenase [Armatimonadota bacterium]
MGVTTVSEVEQKARQAREAARLLASAPTGVKNAALLGMADAIVAEKADLLSANAIDVAAAREKGISDALIDRLSLNDKRIEGMAEGLNVVAALPDPIGEVIKGWRRPNGLRIRKVRVPLGVIGIIYESRPNVTADAAALCLKAGNACVLRGGTDAINSNKAIADVLMKAAQSAGVPANAIQLIETTDRAAANELMRMDKYVDALVPRGGVSLARAVAQNATVPVIFDGGGVCHTFVERTANLKMAEEIAYNAKVQRCSVCNAMETLLVDEPVAREFLPKICGRLAEAGVDIRGCDRTRAIYPAANLATDEDWETEYLALILSIKVVSGVDEAIEHITRHGTRHSECIVTQDYNAARKFEDEVDAACVYVNASTRFTDGYEFGFGAEIGISNQKLHARGPMGLEEITTYKYVINGDGQVRS